MTKEEIIQHIGSALKDIINAAGNGQPYSLKELLGDDFKQAREALAEVEEQLDIVL